MATPRILETVVPARFPESGPVIALIVGEAPGPRGADKSQHPWWGDEAGKLLLKGLYKAGLFRSVSVRGEIGGLFDLGQPEIVRVEPDFDSFPLLRPWSGERFAREGILPVLEGVALTNAWAKCPTKTGESFHRPTEKQMAGAENVERMAAEAEQARLRAPDGVLCVVALGTAAGWLLGDHMNVAKQAGVVLVRLPHPAPQGILSWRRKLGNTQTVPEVRDLWVEELRSHLC